MKKLPNHLLMFAVIGSVVFLTNCGNDDEDPSATSTIEAQEVQLGGQQNDATGGFYNAIDHKKYATDEVGNQDDTIDLLFYFVNNNTLKYIIAAPDNFAAQRRFYSDGIEWPLATENSTRFKPIESGFDFEGAKTSEALEKAYPEAGDDQERMVQLQIDQVFAFRTADTRGSRYGLIQVVNVGGIQDADRSITVNVKIQAKDN